MRTTTRTFFVVATLSALTLTAWGGSDDAEPVAEAASDAPEAPTAEPPAAAAELPGYGLVTPQEAEQLAATDGVIVIDVRTPEEFAEGHIEGSTMIDFYEPGFADEIAALDRDAEYLLYCRSGNRSGQTAAFMAELGFDQVWDLDGGVIAYGAAGLDLTGR